MIKKTSVIYNILQYIALRSPVELLWCLKDQNFRFYYWLCLKHFNSPRYKEYEIKYDSLNLKISDIASFLPSFKEIFVERIYEFLVEKKNPVILDCGANIGLATIFLKTIYPKAKIISFEPDPFIFKYLKENIHRNNFTDVTLINKAVWNKNTKLNFLWDGADGGHVTNEKTKRSNIVEAVDLRDYLNKYKIDFVKLDIEGSENIIFEKCSKELFKVPFIFFEYHSFVNAKQMIGEILYSLEKNGYRIHIHPVSKISRPFLKSSIQNVMDFQMNIFCWKQ